MVFFINCCCMISWVAVPTLAVFTYIANSQPVLLEIPQKNAAEGRDTLMVATWIYLVLAIFLGIISLVTGGKKTKTHDPLHGLKEPKDPYANVLAPDADESFDDDKEDLNDISFQSGASEDDDGLVA